MFRKREDITPAKTIDDSTPTTRVTSVLGPGIAWKGAISGSGGVRVEGAFDGNIHLRGMRFMTRPYYFFRRAIVYLTMILRRLPVHSHRLRRNPYKAGVRVPPPFPGFSHPHIAR